MEKFLDSRDAVSPIMGIFLLVGLVMVMASVVAVFFTLGIQLPESGSGGGGGASGSGTCVGAGFKVVEIKTGLSPSFNFTDNQIILEHTMGCSLDVSRTEITINGNGEAQISAYGTERDKKKEKGDITVVYVNLGYDKKEPNFKLNNPDISDGLLSPGDRLVLNGDDGKNPTGGGGSTVIVNFTIGGDKNKKSDEKTSNDWAFAKNVEITITIKDIDEKQIIPAITATTK